LRQYDKLVHLPEYLYSDSIIILEIERERERERERKREEGGRERGREGGKLIVF